MSPNTCWGRSTAARARVLALICGLIAGGPLAGGLVGCAGSDAPGAVGPGSAPAADPVLLPADPTVPGADWRPADACELVDPDSVALALHASTVWPSPGEGVYGPSCTLRAGEAGAVTIEAFTGPDYDEYRSQVAGTMGRSAGVTLVPLEGLGDDAWHDGADPSASTVEVFAKAGDRAISVRVADAPAGPARRRSWALGVGVVLVRTVLD